MLDKVKELISEVSAFNTTSKDEIETFRIKFLSKKGCDWIDCQQLTSHLSSLGGIEIPRNKFMALLENALQFRNINFPLGNF